MRSSEEYRKLIDEHLTDLIPDLPPESSLLSEAMSYSLKVGGKRLRPTLLLAAAEFAGASAEEAMPYALALEYIHTYSLIHDDLPAMDNDDLRRGKPTNHKVYGEAMAILAGDGLLSRAAEIVTSEPLRYADDPLKMKGHIRAASEIMARAGSSGMVAGQTADVTSENTQASAGLVDYIEKHKTADLIIAPVRAGLMIAGAPEDTLDAFTRYAEAIGIAFQVLDDILDFESDAETLGKTPGKDAEEGKCSYVLVHGMDAAKAQLKKLTEAAKDALAGFGKEAVFFTDLADSLAVRTS